MARTCEHADNSLPRSSRNAPYPGIRSPSRSRSRSTFCSFPRPPRNQRSVADEEVELDADELDRIAYSGDAFDLGEAIAQTLGLAVDPYAEGPNAAAIRAEVGIKGDDQPSGPLAEALARLKKE